MAENISRTPIAPTSSITLRDDETKLLFLSESIRDERYEAGGSSSISLLCNPTSDASPAQMLAKLFEYLNQQTLRSIEPLDAKQFDLHDF